MNVSSVLSPAAAAPTGSVNNSTNTTATAAPAATMSTDVYTSKISAIAAKYDPSNISLDQVPELANELSTNGLISGTEAVVLASLPIISRHLKDGDTVGLSAGANGNVNLLQYAQAQFDTAKSLGNNNQLADQENTIDTLEAMSSYRQAQSGTSVSNAPESALDVQGAISAYAAGIDNSTVDTQRIMVVLDALATTGKISNS